MTDRIFVMGAGGFIGRALSDSLASSGFRVLAATRQPTPFVRAGVENIVSPFSECGHFAPWLGRCNAVVHAASLTTPSSSAAHPQLDGNLRSTLALIEALQDFPSKRLLYLSSGGALYEERLGLVEETTPLRPRSYHGAGKAAAEHFIQAWSAQYGGAATILRPSNVYGPGQHPRPGFGVIPAAFECIRSNRPLQIRGDGESVRDYLYVDDLVSLCRDVLRASPGAGGTELINASSGNGTSLLEMLSHVERATGQGIRKEFLPERSVDMKHVVPDSSLARRRFGWEPRVSLDDGLSAAWRWYRDVYG
ncbi:NAD-dependent epimerase/dehydratase family protein [Luteimonas sp. WGS1318]|uniref:NAD-dependent epimerase/dehydratase family protein n=1 Tax=Luteimonas sp. WGS1318 TaxID=3366815 RepID=UPI00372D3677